MKTQILLIFATLVVFATALTDSQKEKLAEIYKPCKEESGVSDDVIKKFAAGEAVEDSKFNKYLICGWKIIGLADPDGKIVEAKLHERVKAAAESEEEAEKICKKCKKVQKDTPEEIVYEVIKCLFRELPDFSPVE